MIVRSAMLIRADQVIEDDVLVLRRAGARCGVRLDSPAAILNQSGRMVTLDDGTQIVIPATLTVEKSALKPGANVKVSYDEKDGQKVAKSFTVMPAR